MLTYRNYSRSLIRKINKQNIRLKHDRKCWQYAALVNHKNACTYVSLMNTLDTTMQELKAKEKEFINEVVKMKNYSKDFASKVRLIKKMFLWIDKTIHKLYNYKGDDNMETE